MRAIVHAFHTQVFPTDEEVLRLCKPGCGADTCIFLTMSPDGWECHGLNKMPIYSMIERAERGETNAQRQGCEQVMLYVPTALGDVEIGP